MKAKALNIQVSPRKVRLVADSIRGVSVEKALRQLEMVHKHAAGPLTKLIKSALANAVNSGKSAENLHIESLVVNEGITLKRYHEATHGRISPYAKRRSHILVTLKEGEKKNG